MDGASLLRLIEEANYDYTNIQRLVNERIEECEKRIRELQEMSQEDFMRMISKWMFGVASKDYYISGLRKEIESLKTLPEHIDQLLRYWRDSRNGYFHDSIKYYKPYVRQLKQAFERLGQNRFNSKLPSFSVWVISMAKLRLFDLSGPDDEKCGGCNWRVTKLYALATSQKEANRLKRRGEAGLCGDCMAGLLVEAGYIIENAPQKTQ